MKIYIYFFVLKFLLRVVDDNEVEIVNAWYFLGLVKVNKKSVEWLKISVLLKSTPTRIAVPH